MNRALTVVSVLALVCGAAAQQTKSAPGQPAQCVWAKLPHDPVPVFVCSGSPQSRPTSSPRWPATPDKLVIDLKMRPLEQPQIQFPPEMRAPEMKAPKGQIRISPEVIDRLKRELTRRIPALPFSPVCYAMDSYVFARENGGDAMRLVEHTTCVPASRFSMKNAVQRVR